MSPPAAELPLGPTLSRRTWALLLAAHPVAGVAAALAGGPAAGVADRGTFALTRLLGGVLFSAGLLALVRAYDGTLALRRPAARWGARAAAFVAVAYAHAALWIVAGGWLDPALGAQTRADLPAAVEEQSGFSALFFAGHSLLYYGLRRRAVARAAVARAAAADAAWRDARLHALALELQPHFLFNTLNAAAQLVHEDPPAAERMLVTLGDLLRLTVAGGREPLLPLAEELRRLDLYLALQRLRFGARLTVRRDVPDALLGARVPAMLLQPLVENALSHGIGARPGPGTLTVAAAAAGGRLVLRVADDGAGLGGPAPAREGTGLRNTRERLETLYPGAHRFAVRPGPGGRGAEAVAELPLAPGTAAAATAADA